MNRKLILVVLALGLGACLPPKILVANSVETKYLLQSTGSKNLFNFFVRICDAQGEKSVNCRDSQVLDNVVARSVY